MDIYAGPFPRYCAWSSSKHRRTGNSVVRYSMCMSAVTNLGYTVVLFLIFGGNPPHWFPQQLYQFYIPTSGFLFSYPLPAFIVICYLDESLSWVAWDGISERFWLAPPFWIGMLNTSKYLSAICVSFLTTVLSPSARFLVGSLGLLSNFWSTLYTSYLNPVWSRAGKGFLPFYRPSIHPTVSLVCYTEAFSCHIIHLLTLGVAPCELGFCSQGSYTHILAHFSYLFL